MKGPGVLEVMNRVRQDGMSEAARRVARRITRRIDELFDVRSLDFPLADEDISAPQTSYWQDPGSLPVVRGNIAWLCTPPSAGSGGHTTFFRIVEGLEDRGATCTILLYDRAGGDIRRHEKVIRAFWPKLRAEIKVVPRMLEGFGAAVASSWQTAHVLAARTANASGIARYYFIQDYEPYFYPRGSLYSLAEDSYRLGLSHIALGPMVRDSLEIEIGVTAKCVPYGCDLSSYSLSGRTPRSGVVFFARPEVDRRGYDLGRLALEQFHRRQPDQPIHIYGGNVRGWDCPTIQHGVLAPSDLNELYNSTLGGLALSFTNITLVASEMLAAGNIPVLNIHPFAKRVLDNPEAIWVQPTPHSLADGLVKMVRDPSPASRATRAANYHPPDWEDTKQAVVDIMEGRM